MLGVDAMYSVLHIITGHTCRRVLRRWLVPGGPTLAVREYVVLRRLPEMI